MSASPVNVSALFASARDGDRAAWTLLVERFTPLVWATVRGHRLDDRDAADVVQTTWLRVVEHLDRIQNPERLGAWIATTAKRESLRALAGQKRMVPTDGEAFEVADDAPQPADVVARRERDSLVRAALGRLGERCQVLLRMLTAQPAPSYEEVSATLEIPIGSIGPTRGRCLAQLRTELAAVGITGAP